MDTFSAYLKEIMYAPPTALNKNKDTIPFLATINEPLSNSAGVARFTSIIKIVLLVTAEWSDAQICRMTFFCFRNKGYNCTGDGKKQLQLCVIENSSIESLSSPQKRMLLLRNNTEHVQGLGANGKAPFSPKAHG